MNNFEAAPPIKPKLPLPSARELMLSQTSNKAMKAMASHTKKRTKKAIDHEVDARLKEQDLRKRGNSIRTHWDNDGVFYNEVRTGYGDQTIPIREENPWNPHWDQFGTVRNMGRRVNPNDPYLKGR